MNIKLKAAVEVVGVIVVVGLIVTGVQTALTLATEAYGIRAVLNGLGFAAMSVAAYVCVGLLYDQRVARLEYLKKLNEMTKK